MRTYGTIYSTASCLAILLSAFGPHSDACAQDLPPPAAPSANFVERPDSQLLILAVQVNGIQRDDGMLAYLPPSGSYDDLLIPMGQFAKYLSYAVTANPGDRVIDGWFLQQDNTIHVDLKTGEVLLGGKPSEIISPQDAEAHQDDIYVKAKMIEKWFDIRLNLDMGELQLDIDTREDLPFEERLERLKKAQRHLKKYTFENVTIESAKLAPYQMFSLPSLYLSNSTSYSSAKTGNNIRSNTSIQANFDFLKFETDFNMAYQYDQNGQSDISSARLVFQKRDPQRNLLGPLHAGKYAIGDVNYPSVPLFGGGKRGRGVLVSSDPQLGFKYAGDPEGFILDGDAPVGWDAELYRNGSYVGFQTIPSNGRYSFSNLDLVSGLNAFQIILYGPQGQKLYINREIYRGAYMLKKGETQYDFAAGQPDSDFLPLAQNYRKDTTPGMSAQAFYGLNNYLTLGASAYTGASSSNAPDAPERDSGATLTASSSFLGMNLSGHVMMANQSRKAYQTTLNMRPMGYNLSFTHTQYSGFHPDDQDISRSDEFSAYKNFGPLNLNLIASETTYQDKSKEYMVENIVSANFLGIKFTNDLTKIFSKSAAQRSFLGELSALTNVWDLRLRAALSYDLDSHAVNRLRSFTLSGQHEINSRSSIRFGASRDFGTSIDDVNVLYSRDFDKFGVDFGVTANTENAYTFTVGMRAALQADENNRYHLTDPRTGGLASVGGRAFVDVNNNGEYDPEIDTAINNVEFRSSSTGTKSHVDTDGVAWLSGLGESPTRLSVLSRTIPDIYLVPNQTHQDIIPRKGVNDIVDFPFSRLGEVEGSVLYNKDGVANVPVRIVLINDKGEEKVIDSTESEYDGYYIFPALRGGKYRLDFGDTEKSDTHSLSIDFDLNPMEKDTRVIDAHISKDLRNYLKEMAERKSKGLPRHMQLDEKDLIVPSTKDIENILD